MSECVRYYFKNGSNPEAYKIQSDKILLLRKNLSWEIIIINMLDIIVVELATISPK